MGSRAPLPWRAGSIVALAPSPPDGDLTVGGHVTHRELKPLETACERSSRTCAAHTSAASSQAHSRTGPCRNHPPPANLSLRRAARPLLNVVRDVQALGRLNTCRRAAPRTGMHTCRRGQDQYPAQTRPPRQRPSITAQAKTRMAPVKYWACLRRAASCPPHPPNAHPPLSLIPTTHRRYLPTLARTPMLS